MARPTDVAERREFADAPTADAGAGQDNAPDVFISYSRSDQQVVLRLAEALEAAGWRVWVDIEDIPPTADWGDELAAGIRAAHTFVFAISPPSVRSQYCLRELDQALELGKRLVPVVLEATDEVPEPLAARQYVYLRDEDDFDASLQTLTTALATDLDWVREHRQWLTAALRWGRERPRPQPTAPRPRPDEGRSVAGAAGGAHRAAADAPADGIPDREPLMADAPAPDHGRERRAGAGGFNPARDPHALAAGHSPQGGRDRPLARARDRVEL